MPPGFTIPSYFTAIDRFSGPLGKMGSAVSGFVAKSTTALSYAERGFRKLMSPLASINKMLMGFGYYLGLFTLIRVLKDALSVMADFQQAQVNISSITGKTVAQNKAWSDQARELALRYGIAAVKISETQYELEKLGGMDVLGVTEASIVGAKGLKIDVDTTSKMLGALLKSYKGVTDATGKPLIGSPQEVMDQLVKIADVTALGGEDLATMVSNSSAAAASAKIPFTELLALFGATRDRMLQTASAGTALKNIFIDDAVKGKTLHEQLTKITSSSSELKKAYQLFNKKSAQTGLVSAQALASGELQANVKILEKSAGYAAKRASDQLNTFNGSVSMAKTAYEELILTIEDGNGPIAKSLNKFVQTVSALLLLTSGSDAANGQLKLMDQTIVNTARTWSTWLGILKWVVITLIGAKVALFAWNAVSIVSRAGMGLFNIAWGVYNAMTGRAVVYTAAQTAAMWAQVIATNAVTAATWLWNAALAVNPIVWIIAAIVAAIALVVIIIRKWNEWGAAFSILLGPVGFLISLIQSLRRNWDLVVEAFSKKGLLEGLWMIGKVILDAVLQPLQQVLSIINRLTGFKWAADAAKEIEKFRTSIEVNTSTDESGKPIEKLNPQAAKQESLVRTIETTQKRVMVDFANVPAGTVIGGDKDSVGKIEPSLTSTLRGRFKFPFN